MQDSLLQGGLSASIKRYVSYPPNHQFKFFSIVSFPENPGKKRISSFSSPSLLPLPSLHTLSLLPFQFSRLVSGISGKFCSFAYNRIIIPGRRIYSSTGYGSDANEETKEMERSSELEVKTMPETMGRRAK